MIYYDIMHHGRGGPAGARPVYVVIVISIVISYYCYW